jgi:hypothetical protein
VTVFDSYDVEAGTRRQQNASAGAEPLPLGPELRGAVPSASMGQVAAVPAGSPVAEPG